MRTAGSSEGRRIILLAPAGRPDSWVSPPKFTEDGFESDHDYLTAGGVFTSDLLETWVAYKRLHEIDEVRLRPHPWEFMLYYDI